MRRFAWPVMATLTIGVVCNSSTAIAQPSTVQASIANFEDVSGTWIGRANDYRVTLEIDAAGKFRASSAVGGERGVARIEGGALVIPLMKHEGTLHLVLDGGILTGRGVLEGKVWTLKLSRKGGSAHW